MADYKGTLKKPSKSMTSSKYIVLGGGMVAGYEADYLGPMMYCLTNVRLFPKVSSPEVWCSRQTSASNKPHRDYTGQVAGGSQKIGSSSEIFQVGGTSSESQRIAAVNNKAITEVAFCSDHLTCRIEFIARFRKSIPEPRASRVEDWRRRRSGDSGSFLFPRRLAATPRLRLQPSGVH